MFKGWIDEVTDGIVYGRTVSQGNEVNFWIPLLSVMDSQRVDLQPGSLVTILNGELAVESVLWTTHEIERARAKAAE